MHKSVVIALLLLISAGLSAQEPIPQDRKIKAQPDSSAVNSSDTTLLENNLNKNVTDTAFLITDTSIVKRPVTRRQNDTIRGPRVLSEFSLSQDFSEEVKSDVDTVFSMSHRFRRADKYSPVNAMLGNYGLPFYQLNFFDRVSDPDKFLYAYYYPFMYVPDRAVFMNNQVPFTELDWSFGGQRSNSEQTFRVKHSQNINRYLNFGLIYDIIFSLGQYQYQRSDNKNFTLFSSYTGTRYKVYFSGGINNLNTHENGGISNIEDLRIQGNMRSVLVNLGGDNQALSVLKNRSMLLVQRYTIGYVPADNDKKSGGKQKEGLSGTFSHILTMESNKRTYSDNSPASGFYDTAYITSGSKPTFDSLYSSVIKNTVRFDFAIGENRKFGLGGGFGIRSEAFRFSQIVPTFDTATVADTTGRGRISNAITGRLYNNIGNKFRWTATGDLYLNGYRTGDFTLNGIITKTFAFNKGPADWNITGSISNRQPSYWLQHWGSNHFVWNQNLSKEFRMNVGTSFVFPARNTKVKVDYAIIDNYTDFDTTAIPVQHSGGLSVAALTLSKGLRAWKFHLSTDIILQKSSNSDILDLPLFSTRTAGYFEHLFLFPATQGALNTQFGVEAVYHSLYHPYAYMPATGRFYRQTDFTAGNYPFINVFVNLKLKRTRIFVMFDHINAKKMGYDFFMVPSYPMNINMMRYGLAWTFYD
ncbi:MAG TPA: putative porin [Bacteroidales bacterium]|nr:putative porin [Bacteroidales bacterium]